MKLNKLKPRLQTLSATKLQALPAGTVERIRGRKLQRIRDDWFSRHPLCVKCAEKNIYRAATQLDHIIALTNGGKDFDQDDGKNRQGLCDDCHDKKTRQDLGHKPRVRIGADGWPVTE